MCQIAIECLLSRHADSFHCYSHSSLYPEHNLREEDPAVIIPLLAGPCFSEGVGMLLAPSCKECDELQAGIWARLQDAAVDFQGLWKHFQSGARPKTILQALESNWEGKRHPHPLTRTVSDINKSQCLDLRWLSSLNNQIILVFPFSHFHNYSKISLLKRKPA